MIRYLEHREIDKIRWDECVNNSQNGLVYAKSWYLDIVSPGWNALIENEYTSVFPLTWRRKFGISYLYQPPFTQQLGLFNGKIENEHTLSDFLLSIPNHYRFIEIQLNSGNNGQTIPASFQSTQRVNHLLDLSHDYPELNKAFSENTQRNIRRFEKTGLDILRECNPEELVSLFQRNRGKDVSTMKANDYTCFHFLCEAAMKRDLLHGFSIRANDGKLIAGSLFLKSDTRYIFFFSALSPQGRESGAMSALIAAFIKDHCKKNESLDFEGSMDPGIARFYKSFGSHEIVYLQIRMNRLPGIISWLKK